MPHASLKITDGVDTNKTPALNEAGLSQSQLIRYMPEADGTILVQKLGGWAKYYGNQIQSMVRCLWPWNDQNDSSHLAFGADAQLAILTNGSLNDITPNTLSYSVPVHMVTTAGSPIVTVTDGGNYVGTTASASGDGTTATITYTGTAFIYPIGSSISVSGVTPIGFNGNYIVTVSSAGSVSYKNTTLGPQTIAGTVENQSATVPEDTVYIKTPVSVGGLTLFGLYYTTPLTANTYTITAVNVYGNPLGAPYATTSQTTTTTSGDGTTATLGFAGPYTFPVGTQIIVSGVTPTGYNGTFIVTASTTTSVSYLSSATGGQSVAGTITDYGSVAQYSMTSGSPIVTVTFYNHGYLAGDPYSINVPTVVNGLVLSGVYDVLTVVNSYQFTISTGINASAVATTGASGNGTTATLMFLSGNYAFPVGSTITVSGVTPSGFNGTSIVTASTSTSVSYLNATSGPQTIAGTIWRSDAYIPQNDGNVALEYFIGQTTTSAGAGFGAGGFGDGGFGVGVSPAPAAGVPLSTTDWFLDNWGSLLVACPNIVTQTDFGSPIYVYDPTQSSPSASIITQGPLKSNGIFVAMPQRQIIAWGATFTGLQDHLLLAWCDVSDFTVWADQPQNQAGSYRLPRGSRIIGGLQAVQQGLLWTDIALWSMQYIGQPDIYGFNEIATGCGLIAPKAMGILNGAVYWMSQSQFFVMNANGIQILPCPIWDTIYQQLDANNLNHIRFAANSRFGEVSWFIPIIGGNGENGFCAKYNTIINKWDYSFTPLTRTAWTNQSILGAPIGAGTDGYIYQHEFMNGQTLFNADTQAMVSSFTTGLFQISEGELLNYIDQFWPDMKWGLFGGTQSANVQFTFYVYNYPNSTPMVFGPYTVTQAIEYFTPRFRGRLVAMKVGSSDINSFWRMGTNRFRYQPDGKF